MVDWQGDKPKMARTPKNFRKLIKRSHASWRDDNLVVLGRAPSARGWLVGNKVRQRKPGFYGVHLQKVPLVRDLPHSDRDPTTGSICFRCLVPGADLVEGCLSEWGTGRSIHQAGRHHKMQSAIYCGKVRVSKESRVRLLSAAFAESMHCQNIVNNY